jgi:hypothetical protein
MKLFLSFGILFFAMTFCGISDRLKSMSGGSNTSDPSNTSKPADDGGDVETAALTPAQQAIMDANKEMKWDDQGISWKIPESWKKMELRKESLNYGSPDNAFLIGTISVMSDDFPSDVSLKATYESSMQQLKNGKYESARYLEIDGIKGVEFLEAVPEDKDGIRRYQWIAFRHYQGQNQQLNIMLSTTQDKWDKHKDEFPAILYSMKISQ